ncbi:basic proline-rich protein-like [Cygnus atratus]|uniref:basic proline-rich protein-like n=1 Tax=Cygnus atratus TaxID=8868 RepID=UPI0015D590A1|nr:basic proline-rich protein-like [Cygnus atratus]
MKRVQKKKKKEDGGRREANKSNPPKPRKREVKRRSNEGEWREGCRYDRGAAGGGGGRPETPPPPASCSPVPAPRKAAACGTAARPGDRRGGESRGEQGRRGPVQAEAGRGRRLQPACRLAQWRGRRPPARGWSRLLPVPPPPPRSRSWLPATSTKPGGGPPPSPQRSGYRRPLAPDPLPSLLRPPPGSPRGSRCPWARPSPPPGPRSTAPTLSPGTAAARLGSAPGESLAPAQPPARLPACPHPGAGLGQVVQPGASSVSTSWYALLFS